MSLNKWHQMCERVLTEAEHVCRQDPGNARLAVKAIETALQHPHREAFRKLGQFIRSAFPGDAEIQAMLGSAHSGFGQYDAAAKAFQTSLAIEPSLGIQEALARVLVRQMQPQKAWPLLTHVLDGKQIEKRDLLFFVVEGYQALGLHDDALRVLNLILKPFPQLESNENFRLYRKLSESHQASRKKIISRRLAAPPRGF